MREDEKVARKEIEAGIQPLNCEDELRVVDCCLHSSTAGSLTSFYKLWRPLPLYQHGKSGCADYIRLQMQTSMSRRVGASCWSFKLASGLRGSGCMGAGLRIVHLSIQIRRPRNGSSTQKLLELRLCEDLEKQVSELQARASAALGLLSLVLGHGAIEPREIHASCSGPWG